MNEEHVKGLLGDLIQRKSNWQQVDKRYQGLELTLFCADWIAMRPEVFPDDEDAILLGGGFMGIPNSVFNKLLRQEVSFDEFSAAITRWLQMEVAAARAKSKLREQEKIVSQTITKPSKAGYIYIIKAGSAYKIGKAKEQTIAALEAFFDVHAGTSEKTTWEAVMRDDNAYRCARHKQKEGK